MGTSAIEQVIGVKEPRFDHLALRHSQCQLPIRRLYPQTPDATPVQPASKIHNQLRRSFFQILNLRTLARNAPIQPPFRTSSPLPEKRKERGKGER